MKNQFRRMMAGILAMLMVISSPVSSLAEVKSASPSEATTEYETASLSNASYQDEEAVAHDVEKESDAKTPDLTYDADLASPSEAEEIAFNQSQMVDGVVITVTADKGVFPQGAKLRVSKITDKKDLKDIDAAVEEVREEDKNVASSNTFDIQILDRDGNEIEPDNSNGTINVKFSLAEKLNEVLDVAVYHVEEATPSETGHSTVLQTSRTDEEDIISDGELIDDVTDNVKKEATPEYSNIQEESHETIWKDNMPQEDRQKGLAETPYKAEALKTEVKEKKNNTEITVGTDGFSYYTVEFTYGNLQYVLAGDTSVKLSEIQEKIGLIGTVSDAKVSDEELFMVTKDESDDDWTVTAKRAFTSKEWMEIMIADKSYEILVTDTSSSYGVDLSSAGYQTNINPYFARGYVGECTWYVWGRAYEKLGIQLPWTGNANDWTANAAEKGFITGKEPRENSIMVEHYNPYGHVFFVEKIENGKAYVTEGNYSGNYHEDVINLSTMKRNGWSTPLNPIDYIYLEDINNPPQGWLDSAEGGPGTVHVKGWAFDPDYRDSQLDIHVYVGGRSGESNAECHVIKTGRYREDVHAVHGGWYYGFEETIHVNKRGNQPVYVYAINKPQGNNPELAGSGKIVNIQDDKVWFDLNGRINGVNEGALMSAGTADVYINGKCVANDVADFYQQVTVGSTYEIKDIKAKPGYAYAGPVAGEANLSGTVQANGVYVRLAFNTASYKVDFSTKHGTKPATQILSYNKTAKNPGSLKATGYTFGGWYADSGYKTKFDFNKKITKDTTIYAKWTPVTYYISFAGNGASSGKMSKMTCKYGTEYAITKNAYKRTGYAFTGWKCSNGKTYANGASISNLSSKSGSTLTMTAQWEKSYTITYNLDGGKNSTSNPAYYLKSKAVTFKNPTKTGYTFGGWYTAKTGGKKVTGIAKGSTGNKTFYARWTPIKYKIVFDGNGATEGTTRKIVSLAYDKTYKAQNLGLKKTNYILEGWNTKKDGTGKTYKVGTSLKNLSSKSGATVTLYAKWRIARYTIKFNANGGTGKMSDLKINVGASKNLTANAFKRSGYKFTGWNTKADGKGTSFADKKSVKNLSKKDGATVTLYAQWKKTTYTITYNLDGGKNSSKNPKSYSVTTSTITLVDPTKTGYKFGGWYSDSKYKTKVTSIKKGSTGNKTFYAKWSTNAYKIAFNANGGTGTAPKTISTSYGKTITLTSNPFKKTGYTFTGWNTAKDGSGKSYANKASVKNLTSKSGATVTLYAQWKKISDWVLESKLPKGAKVVDTKWKYTKVETKYSDTVTKGWTDLGQVWQKTGSGTNEYAFIPNGYNSTDAIYKKYAASSKLSSYTKDKTKRTVTDSEVARYVYWHWTWNNAARSNYNVFIADVPGWEKERNYQYFAAFESTDEYGHIDPTNANGGDCFYAWRNIVSDGSWWWLRFPVYRQTYTDYKYTHKLQKKTAMESTKEVKASSTITNVKKYVRYIK